MNEIRTLEAIDDALRGPSWCACGEHLALVEREDGLWLSCPAFSRASRLPHALSEPMRELLHDRRFVVDPRPESLDERLARLMAA